MKDEYTQQYIGKYVVVSTDETKRGVFFGKLKEFNPEDLTISLEESQMCVRWSEETRGFNGLAANGPMKGSRITEPVPEQYLVGVSCVMLASDAAIKRWKKCPWE